MSWSLNLEELRSTLQRRADRNDYDAGRSERWVPRVSFKDPARPSVNRSVHSLRLFARPHLGFVGPFVGGSVYYRPSDLSIPLGFQLARPIVRLAF